MSAVLGRKPLPRLDGLVRDIEEAILSGDRGRQSELLLHSADVLTRRWSRLPVSDKPAFDLLLSNLLDQVDDVARAAFARHLAPLRRAPRRAATRLATDPLFDVARPLLEDCPSFDDAWLGELIPVLGEIHLQALARRRAVSPMICDALVRHGSLAVAALLLGNPGADVPAALLSTLTARAAEAPGVAAALACRADLSGTDRAVLVSLTRREALAGLVADLGCGEAEADALLDRVAATFAAPVPPERAAAYASAAAIAGRPDGFGRASVGSARLLHWMALRRVEDVVAVLGRDAGLPVDVVIACAETADRSALAVVLRGLGHSWGLLKALMHLPRAAQPTPETLAAIHRLHADMGEPTARHVARHAAVRLGLSAFTTVSDEPGSRGVTAVAAMTTPEPHGTQEAGRAAGRAGDQDDARGRGPGGRRAEGAGHA